MCAALTAVLLAACGRAAGPAAQRTGAERAPLTVAAYYWPGFYWVDVANAKGWFADEGLDVRIIDANRDYFASVTDFMAGRIDVAGVTLFDLVSHRALGDDVVGVAVCDLSAGADGIAARAGFDTLEGLRHARVGLARATYSEYLLDVVLRRDGISLSTVRLVNINPEQAGEAIAAGQVDAVVTWEPELSEAVKKGRGRKLWDTGDIPGINPSVISVHRSLMRQRPDDVRRVLAVWLRATRFIEQQPAEAYAIVARTNHKNPDEVRAFARLDRVVSLRDNLILFSFSEGFESIHGTARVMNDFLLKQKQSTVRLNTADFLDPAVIKELR